MSDPASPPHLSWSQVSTFAECGEQYRLSRLFGLDKTSWYATVAGSVMHLLTASYDEGAGIVAADWEEHFTKAVKDEVEAGVILKPSGKYLKQSAFTGGPTKKDFDWWIDWGERMLDSYILWAQDSGGHHWSIPEVFDGDVFRLAIELEFEGPLRPNGPRVRGAIDRVFEDAEGYIICDLKTGAEPGGRLQLATYRAALKAHYGIDASRAMYLSPYWDKDSKSVLWGGKVHTLEPLDIDRVIGMYDNTRHLIDEGRYLPNTRACGSCSVKEFCWAMEGEYAWTVPPPDEKGAMMHITTTKEDDHD